MIRAFPRLQCPQAQFAPEHRKARALRVLRIDAPRAVHGPETAEIFLPHPGRKAHKTAREIEGKAAERQQNGVGCHGARVIATAFHFVPGIAPVAIVPRSDGADDFQPFLEHAVEQHGNGRLVFKAIHGFLRVWHGDHGLFHALGPGAHHHAALVVERIQAAGVEVIAHAEEIVLINGAQRAARALRIQNRAQADQLRVPLAGKLVDGATMPNLVFDLLRFFVPIGS